jgi:hypothetical protein
VRTRKPKGFRRVSQRYFVFSRDWKVRGASVPVLNLFSLQPENIENIEKVLRSFYDYNKVVELRHKSWSEEGAEIKRLLEDYK